MLKKLFKALIDTLKDPDLLSSRPHHGEDIEKDHPLKGIYGREGDFTGQRLVHDEDSDDWEWDSDDEPEENQQEKLHHDYDI